MLFKYLGSGLDGEEKVKLYSFPKGFSRQRVEFSTSHQVAAVFINGLSSPLPLNPHKLNINNNTWRKWIQDNSVIIDLSGYLEHVFFF